MAYDTCIVIALLALAFTGVVYGTLFLRRGNPLLGYEWYILAFSASNAALYFVNGNTVHLNIALFCDAFSRVVGIPVIGTLGFMQLTHRLELSKGLKIGVFVLGAVVAGLLLASPTLYAFLPAGSVLIGLIFTWIMIHMAVRLLRAGNILHAGLMALTTAAFFVVSLTDGLFPLANPGKIVFLDFWFYSDVIWALGFAEMYYAYRALERASEQRTGGLAVA